MNDMTRIKDMVKRKAMVRCKAMVNLQFRMIMQTMADIEVALRQLPRATA